MKKGYMYTLDAAVAVIILVLGLILIASIYVYTPDKARTDDLNSDITGLLSTVRVSDLCSGCSCSYANLQTLCNSGKIKNRHATLLELMGQLYHDKERVAIETIVNDLLRNNGVVPGNYGLQIVLFDPAKNQPEQLYPLVGP